MEKCFNCGATVRPGAKFCTSCGTRLIDNPAPPTSTPSTPEASAWGQGASDGATQVSTPSAMSGSQQESPNEREGDTDDASPFASWKHASSGWNTPTDTSPADRFETGLDGSESPRDDDGSASTSSAFGWTPPSTRETSEEDRFASWAAAYRSPDAGDSAGTGASTPERDDSEQVLVAE